MTIVFERCRLVARTGSVAMMIGLGSLIGCTSDLPSRPAGTGKFLVESVRLSHQVTFASDTVEMSPAAPEQLIVFLNDADPDGKAEIFLDAKGPDSDGRLDVVAAMLGHLGRVSSGAGGPIASDIGVTVTVTDDILLPASCMDSDQWPSASLPPSSCTNALTLVRMVEDPDDLLRGRKLGPASGARAAEVASSHMMNRAPAVASELPASATPETGQQPQLPPAATTQGASY